MNEPDNNPFAPPAAIVIDENQSFVGGNFIAGGRKVPAANGMAWISSAWAMFKQTPGAWIGLFLLMFVVMIFAVFIPFGSMLITPLLLGGVMIACENQRETGSLNVGDLFAGFQNHLGPLCLVGLLQFAFQLAVTLPVVIITILVTFGALASGHGIDFSDLSGLDIASVGIGILFLILLLAVLMSLVIAAVWFAPALVVHQGLAPFEAMKQSFRACMRNMGAGTIYMIISMVFGLIIVVFTLGLGLLVFAPVMQASIYTAYRDIFFEE